MNAPARTLAAVVRARVAFVKLARLLQAVEVGPRGDILREANAVELLFTLAEAEAREAVELQGAPASAASRPVGSAENRPQTAAIGSGTTIEPPACPHCGACSVSAPEVATHLRLRLVGARVETFRCSKCRRAFAFTTPEAP